MNDENIDRYFNADHMTRSRKQATGWRLLVMPPEVLIGSVIASLVGALAAARAR